MKLSDILSCEQIACGVGAKSKRALLKECARLASQSTNIPEQEILEKLLERERLGSTGLGGGVAIPHGKFQGLDHMVGLFLTLDKKVEFDALDDRPVDLVFILLTPALEGTDHLQALSVISRILRDKKRCKALRNAESARDAYQLLMSEAPAMALADS